MLNDSKTFNKDTSKFDTFDLLVPKKESKTDQSNFGESLELSEISENDDVFPPFPYKVAKALDPNQYRNVAYDAWHQDRKGKILLQICILHTCNMRLMYAHGMCRSYSSLIIYL